MAAADSVMTAWMQVMTAQQDAQARVNASFQRHGPLGVNVIEAQRLAAAGRIPQSTADTIGQLFDAFRTSATAPAQVTAASALSFQTQSTLVITTLLLVR